MEAKHSDGPIDLRPLESVSVLVSDDAIVRHKQHRETGRNKSFFQRYNQICTCILRIRETSGYLNSFTFRKANEYGEAFDFYEFINCISIIEGCCEVLLKCFDFKLKDAYGKFRAFMKSNHSRRSDIDFFRFIRSAVAVHPAETNKQEHQKITHKKHEFYPYAVWCNGADIGFLNDTPKWADISVLSWDSKPDGQYKHYYLDSHEFYLFANHLVASLFPLKLVIQQIIEDSREKERCKRLKKLKDFDNASDYCLYLRKRLERTSLNGKYEFRDGGLLIASHLVANPVLENGFKNYVLKRVNKLREKMMKDITNIYFSDVFDELDLSVSVSDHYIVEKFDYLEQEARYEIATNNYESYKTSLIHRENPEDYSEPEWETWLLLSQVVGLYDDVIDAFNCELSFTDVYEITLQQIWKKLKEEKKP